MLKSVLKLFSAAVLMTILPILAQSQQVQQSQVQSSSLDVLIGASSFGGNAAASNATKLSLVRETILRETAMLLGARAGLSDRSREIFRAMDSRQEQLDQIYRFNELVMGNNVLPPVISESKDVVALEAAAMRVAGLVYRIDEPARFALPTPTWRNWLFLGLDDAPLNINGLDPVNLPQDAAEKAFWDREVNASYQMGRDQAQASFDFNFSSLKRSYSGMRKFYELWQRGMVTAPVIMAANELIVRDDSSTVSVGNTVFRITAPTDFTQPNGWVPLE